jgi:hypothetical protein
MDRWQLVADLQRQVAALQDDVARNWHVLTLILAIQVTLLILSATKLLLMDRVRAAMRYSGDSVRQMSELLARAMALSEREGREVAQANLNAARLAENAAKKIFSTMCVSNLETIRPPSDHDIHLPPMTEEQKQKAMERHERNRDRGDSTPGAVS